MSSDHSRLQQFAVVHIDESRMDATFAKGRMIPYPFQERDICLHPGDIGARQSSAHPFYRFVAIATRPRRVSIR